MMTLPYCRHPHQPGDADAAALEFHAVSVRYPDSPKLALHVLTCCIPAGTRIALVGHNGAGKSTLLKAATGLLPLCGGHICIYGQPLGTCHHRVAYLPQHSQLNWQFPISVRQFVLTGRYVHLGWLRRPGRHDHQRVSATLERLDLAALGECQIGQLSGGQQQRLLLARALVQEADLLLLDEPLTAVDAATRATLSSLLAELQRQGKTFLVATHEVQQLEQDFDGVLHLRDGHRVTPASESLPGWQGQS